MSTVAADEAFDFDAVQAQLERHLGVADTRFKRWYNKCRVDASNWLCNTWTDADGLDIPKTDLEIEGIRLALFEGVRARLKQDGKTPGLTSVSTGAASQTYGAASGGAAIAMVAMAQDLYTFRLSIELL